MHAGFPGWIAKFEAFVMGMRVENIFGEKILRHTYVVHVVCLFLVCAFVRWTPYQQ